MKKIIVLIMLFIAAQMAAQKKAQKEMVRLKKTEKVKLNPKQIQVVKSKESNMFRLNTDYLVAGKNYAFYTGKSSKGTKLIYVLGPKVDLPEVIDATFIPNLSIISESATEMVYCSCGSNINRDEGDNCQHYATTTGTACGGACIGDFEGQSCSITRFNIDTGIIDQMFY